MRVGPQTPGKAVIIGALSGLLQGARERFPIVVQMQFDPNIPSILVQLNEGGRDGKWYLITATEVKIDSDGKIESLEE